LGGDLGKRGKMEEKISFLGNSIKGNFYFRLDRKLSKKEILMAGIISNGDPQMDCFGHVTFQKRKFFDEFFFDLGKQNCLFGKYFPRSDFQKRKSLMAYISDPETTLGGGFQKRNFDGLCKQDMWLC